MMRKINNVSLAMNHFSFLLLWR